METAFTNATGRVNPDFTDLSSGAIGGLVLVPGLYTWTSGVNVLSDVTISGTATDTWIFQISGTLVFAAGKQVTLVGGALANNIVWAVSGSVTAGAGAHLEGVVLGKTSISLLTGATANSRLLAQTSVALQQATVNN
ncbi:Ig-like protein, group 2 [Mycena filopes]|nr:Ig-like protein, group 2 [Mycena filopes]KAJ7174744.1 Ig-like protein, group 2 [Mycena filopes]